MIEFARRTYQAYLGSAQTVVASGTRVLGYQVLNSSPFPVTVSGVPIWDDPRYPNAPRVGVNVPVSGTVNSEQAFFASGGLRFSSSAASNSVQVRVFADLGR